MSLVVVVGGGVCRLRVCVATFEALWVLRSDEIHVIITTKYSAPSGAYDACFSGVEQTYD